MASTQKTPAKPALKKPKGLGRGLEALLGPKISDMEADAAPGPVDGAPRSLALDQMVPGAYQPRTRMDEGALYELAESIKAQGIMQPILVRRLSEDQARQRRADGVASATAKSDSALYEIIAGERRFRAARIAGLKDVPVLVRAVADEAAAAMALIENIQREDLNPLEEAHGIQRLVKEFGLTHEQAAQAVGRSRSAASNLLRLLNLAEPVQTMLMAGDIDMGHARALLGLTRAQQITAGNQIIGKKLSVRETENLVKRLAQEDGIAPAKSKSAGKSRDLLRVEEELADLLTADVDIRVKKRVKRHGQIHETGELAIAFSSLEELNALIERLRGAP
ncbi:MAG: putative chromosome-partitioning protein ParB [Paracidovorax wautersii]|uniref:Putative chromosome-partitioning protein ParB n=1 Tax=Paracidovorax wautersii TaxID=1177982 RepID=A0A7V8FQS3_9BURK|nr:MAG: putative chromosome-partitioning protein ParB [Paracidovorax wautersii]